MPVEEVVAVREVVQTMLAERMLVMVLQTERLRQAVLPISAAVAVEPQVIH